MLMKLMDEIRIVTVPGVYEESRRVLDLRLREAKATALNQSMTRRAALSFLSTSEQVK